MTMKIARDFVHTIDGLGSHRGGTFAVVEPATGVPFADSPDATAAELEAAVAAAERAFVAWRVDDEERCALMLKCADALEDKAQHLGALLTREQGKPLGDAVSEIHIAATWLRYYAGLDLGSEVLRDDEAARVEVLRQPLGPVAAITPWNVPVALAFWKVAPALRAGNTVVLKPSPYTPLTTLKIGELLASILPAGVLNVVAGLDPLGAKLTAHPAIRKITFTGSTETGRRVATAAAADLKRVTLELGGNDPAIVLDDADPEDVAAGIFISAMSNAGQVCVAVKRVYVPRAMHDDVIDALCYQASGMVMGNGLEAGVRMGPVNNKPQLDRVAGLVDAAVTAGAKAVVGGAQQDGPGYFYAPTVLTGADDSMAVVAEEQFGPALPVVAYDDVNDVIAQANSSHFGLGSSVWTRDPERGYALGRDLVAGTTWINAHAFLPPEHPFGGVKWSGVGLENGPWAIHEFTDVHVMYENRHDTYRPLVRVKEEL
jgi:acyl-CoA reductase-like NAD-dependent aldehyde dehydrogenase